MATQKYWTQSPDALLAELQSSRNGLSQAEAKQRLLANGPNLLKAKRDESAARIFLRQVSSPIVLILIFATIVSAALGDWADAIIISLIVIASAILSFVQEYRAGNATARLLSTVQVNASVIRDSQLISIPLADVVVGDVITLAAGSLIPADGVLLESKDLNVNQAALTGETFPAEKAVGAVSADGLAERNNAVFMGTNVTNGSGNAVIVATAKDTAFGQIAARLQLRPPETEFERGIRKLGNLLTEVILIMVIVIFALNVLAEKPAIDSLLFSVSLAVGLTPQLLPAIININLSKGAQSMARKGVIVRRLNAIENFGSMDVLCTDKTGTLSLGVIQLDGAVDIGGQPSDSVLQLAAINAHYQTGLQNPLDQAILTASSNTFEALHKLDEIPYDFHRKRLSIICQDGDAPPLMITKGALSAILDVCASVRTGEATEAIDDSQLQAIDARFAAWSQQGLRVLGVATRQVDVQGNYTVADEHDLTLAGFLLFFDPPKPDVAQTIRDLSDLGIRLKIITGDNRHVAAYTAGQIGLADAVMLTGTQMAEMDDNALWHNAEQTTIFAEVDPNQKERIILALQKTGHVVGYMGDGVNDAPALHAADVGISVNTAVDVAREAADFVLLKQDLSVLKEGVLEGRRTFANTLKYIFMATSQNFGNMFSVAGASLLLPFFPLLPKQILLLNFMQDFPELTIATDRVDESFIRTPHRWNVHFIRRFMIIFGVLSSVFDYLTFGVLLLVLGANQTQFRTGWFIESIFSALLVVFALRTQLPITRSRSSRSLALASAIVAVIALLIPYSPLGPALGFEPLDWPYLLAMLAIAFLYFAAAEFTKRWFYRHHSV